MKRAILFGSSGFVGSYLLDELLNNSDYEKVTIVVRTNPNVSHPKLETLIGDYHSLPELKANIAADEIFVTLGTTKKLTPDKDEFYQIDHDYPVLAAKIARVNGVKSIFIVTCVGANANSGIAYLKTKGEVERDIIALDFQYSHIYQPSKILGTRKKNSTMKEFTSKLSSIINPFLIGKYLNKYKGIDGKDIAIAMNNSAKNQSEKVKIYQWKEMKNITTS